MNRVICTTGGKTCLDTWLAANSPASANLVINGVTTQYWIFKNGTVVDGKTNAVLSQTGGEAWLREYAKSITYSTFTYKSKSYRLYPDKRVTDTNDNLICKDGPNCVTYLGLSLAELEELSTVE